MDKRKAIENKIDEYDEELQELLTFIIESGINLNDIIEGLEDHLADMEENAAAIKELNRLLTQPIPSSGEEDSGEQAGDTGGTDTGGGADTEMEPDEPAADEEPEA